MGRLFLSSSYRPRAREGEWGVYFSHHHPGREAPRAREGEWDVFFSHHPKT